jgi:hypothetical protein
LAGLVVVAVEVDIVRWAWYYNFMNRDLQNTLIYIGVLVYISIGWIIAFAIGYSIGLKLLSL